MVSQIVQGVSPISRKNHFRTGLIALFVLLLPVLAACGSKSTTTGSTTFKCGSQGYAEVEIQCEIVKALIESKTDHKVEHVMRLGSSMVAIEAMKANDLQFFQGFTGTLMLGLYEDKVTRELYDPDRAWQFVHDNMLKDYNFWTFKPYGYNNTYALIMTKQKAAELGIKKTSDLASVAKDMVLGTDPTWQNYPGQGYNEWAELYGFKFARAVEMDYGLMFRAVANGDVDAAMAYSTDGRIASLDLVVIEDDKQFNPPYHGLLLTRTDVKENHPDVFNLLVQLEGKTTTEEMIALNAEVDVHEKEPSAVAQEWVKQNFPD